MAASSLLALIDDISTLLDDVAVLTKVAATKTSAVMGDDLALNAEQVAGVRVDRELPVVWAVAKGSFINKLILVPAALAISAFVPAAILPLLMLGGLFLCYEGFEKVAHKLLHKNEASNHVNRVQAVADPAVDLVAYERDKIKGAVRTDFVLSAEIIVITLGTMATASLVQQVTVLSLIGLAATVLVYGLVAGIVKLDDLGLALIRSAGSGSGVASQRALGAWILRAAPVLMKSLSVIGTVAMFTVGGGIIAHAVPFIEHPIEALGERAAAASAFLAPIATSLANSLVGVIAGGLVVAVVAAATRLTGKKSRG